MKYIIFKIAIRVAMWSCYWGFTYDFLVQALNYEKEMKGQI
jgi:hypothetical protein